ncbi:TPA: hypothetical protein U2Q27_003294 [Burkholderia cepacia]|nr:hypothetical protein [Burkholderia cepacia]HEM8511219.1 hypothetical protein [Burkholderia cepacia]
MIPSLVPHLRWNIPTNVAAL